MAEIRLTVPDGETCDGCKCKCYETNQLPNVWECPFKFSGLNNTKPHRDCLAARVKPIVLRGEAYEAQEADFRWKIYFQYSRLQWGSGYASKRNAKRGAERWVKKNLPGAVIEWEG